MPQLSVDERLAYRWNLVPGRLARASSLRRCDHVDPVKIGLIDYGFGGRYFHAPLIAASPECEFISANRQLRPS